MFISAITSPSARSSSTTVEDENNYDQDVEVSLFGGLVTPVVEGCLFFNLKGTSWLFAILFLYECISGFISYKLDNDNFNIVIFIRILLCLPYGLSCLLIVLGNSSNNWRILKIASLSVLLLIIIEIIIFSLTLMGIINYTCIFDGQPLGLFPLAAGLVVLIACEYYCSRVLAGLATRSRMILKRRERILYKLNRLQYLVPLYRAI